VFGRRGEGRRLDRVVLGPHDNAPHRPAAGNGRCRRTTTAGSRKIRGSARSGMPPLSRAVGCHGEAVRGHGGHGWRLASSSWTWPPESRARWEASSPASGGTWTSRKLRDLPSGGDRGSVAAKPASRTAPGADPRMPTTPSATVTREAVDDPPDRPQPRSSSRNARKPPSRRGLEHRRSSPASASIQRVLSSERRQLSSPTAAGSRGNTRQPCSHRTGSPRGSTAGNGRFPRARRARSGLRLGGTACEPARLVEQDSRVLFIHRRSFSALSRGQRGSAATGPGGCRSAGPSRRARNTRSSPDAPTIDKACRPVDHTASPPRTEPTWDPTAVLLGLSSLTSPVWQSRSPDRTAGLRVRRERGSPPGCAPRHPHKRFSSTPSYLQTELYTACTGAEWCT
jgi:hypothetical protein